MSISSLFSPSSPSSTSSSSSGSSSPTSSTLTSPSTSQEPVVKASVQSNPKLVSQKNPQGVKPCCACPDTKKLRDDCFLKYGSNLDEESGSANKCKDIVERHKECMRGFGFNV